MIFISVLLGLIDFSDIVVPDQIGTMSQVGTKKISKEAGPFKNFLSQVGTTYLSFRSQSHQERVFTGGWNWFSSSFKNFEK